MKETSVQHRTSTPLLALLALGVVFGDIGTSPIYAFQQSVSDGQASVAGIYGTVSLIFWALVIVVSVKYLIFVLQADNHGEGGILAPVRPPAPVCPGAEEEAQPRPLPGPDPRGRLPVR